MESYTCNIRTVIEHESDRIVARSTTEREMPLILANCLGDYRNWRVQDCGGILLDHVMKISNLIVLGVVDDAV